MDKKERNLWLFSFGLAAVLVTFYFRILAGVETFYFGDHTLFFEPVCNFIGKTFREGKLPLWNPYSYCGMSQIAIPSPGIFYPFNWLFAILPYGIVVALQMVVHQMIAGVGTFLLIVDFGWGALAAVVAGIVMALCGYMFSLDSNYTLIASAAWLPMCLWLLTRIEGRLSLWSALKLTFASISVFMFVAAGRPEIVASGLVIICLYIILSFYVGWKKSGDAANIPKLLWRGLAVLCGLLLAMPEVLPALEWLSLSRRSHGLVSEEAFLYSANWYDMLCLVLSQPFGDLHLRFAKFLPLVATRPRLLPYISSAFVGPAVFTMAIWGLGDRSWRSRYLVVLLALGFVLFALGDQTPVLPALATGFPAITFVRFPVKILYFVIAVIVIMAARGAYAVSCSQVDRRFEKGAWLLWLVFFVVGGLLVAGGSVGVTFPNPGKFDHEIFLQAQLRLGQASMLGALVGGASCLVAELFRRKKIGSASLKTSLILLTFVSLMHSAFANVHNGAPLNFYSHRSFACDEIERIADNKPHKSLYKPRMVALFLENFTCPPWYGTGSREDKTLAWYQYNRQMMRPNTNMDFLFPSAFGYECSMVGDYYDLFLSSYLLSSQNRDISDGCKSSDISLARFCQMTATEFVVTQKFRFLAPAVPPVEVVKLDPAFFDLKMDDQVMNARVYKVRDVMPRFFLARSARTVKSHREAVELVKNVESSKFDPHECTVIEGESDQIYPLDDPASTIGKPRVDILKDEPEHILVGVRSPAPSLLVIADQYYPGWEARLDTVSVPIMRANAVQRAVVVPAGSHVLEMDFQPKCLDKGILCAETGLSILVIMVVVGFFAGRGSEKRNENG